MMLTLEDLKNGNIYLEKIGMLADRIDYAWKVYSGKRSRYDFEDKKNALMFLIYAFDIQNVKNIYQQLFERMQDRKKHKEQNPEYIPGKKPKPININNDHLQLKQTNSYNSSQDIEISQAFKDRELLDVTIQSKLKDCEVSTPFINAEQRAKYRVLIHDGLFKKNGVIFDTGSMFSHGKQGYAAFTLNANGELSLFNHRHKSRKKLHSSMNHGAPVVAAGELKIENGVLKDITTHSGHYQPTVFNVYRTLEYFSQNRVDISQATVTTWSDPVITVDSKLDSTLHVSSLSINDQTYSYRRYKVPAHQIYRVMDNLLIKTIETMDQQLKSYSSGGFISSLFYLKDSVLQLLGYEGSLTQDRQKLAVNLEKELHEFKASMKQNLSPTEYLEKIETLSENVSKYENENNNLSFRYEKNLPSGRMAGTLFSLKHELEDAEKIINTNLHPELDFEKLKNPECN